MKRRKRCIGILLGVLFVGMCGVVSDAAEQKKEGRIRIVLTDGLVGTSKESVVFGYVKVADLVNDTYIWCEGYENDKVSLEHLEYALELEQAALALEETARLRDTVRTDEEGVAVINSLETGLYLIGAVDDTRYEEVTPMLIAIPTWNEVKEQMEYQVEVHPKHTALLGSIVTALDSSVWTEVMTADAMRVEFYGKLLLVAGMVGAGALCGRRFGRGKRHE